LKSKNLDIRIKITYQIQGNKNKQDNKYLPYQIQKEEELTTAESKNKIP